MNLSPDKIMSMGEMFRQFDEDHSQQISLDEFVKVFRARGKLIINNETKWEKKKDWKILSHFAPFVLFLYVGVSEDEIRSVVPELDLDGNASIDYDEFVAAAMHQNLLQQVGRTI